MVEVDAEVSPGIVVTALDSPAMDRATQVNIDITGQAVEEGAMAVLVELPNSNNVENVRTSDDPTSDTENVDPEKVVLFHDVYSDTNDDTVKPKLHEREQWGHALDFFIACISFAVGLGNVWRFPYFCYKNGGGAFLIPYLVCLVVGGIPLFYLEVALGQRMSVSGVNAWNICPIFKGIAVASLIIVFFINIYYNVVIAWALYYMFASFTTSLPWGSCDNDWNTPNCTDNKNMTRNIGNETFRAGTDSVTEFWKHKVLGLTDGIDVPGGVKWELALCLLLAWLLVYLCICKGIRSSGKIMYVTALAPYILLTVLLIRGVTLTGASDGIIYFLKPDFDKLTKLAVWVDAGSQIFFSYAIAIGGLTALGSYNKFHHNSYKDAIIFAFTNSGTSIFGGFVIFSVLGHMAYERGLPMDEVAEKGPGLVFIVYPRALLEMFAAPAWSIVFFFTILLLGIDSQFVGVESMVSIIVDQWPHILRVGYRREMLSALLCFVLYLIGLTMCTGGGMYVFQLFDYYTGSKTVLLIGFCECVAIAWVYGIKRFYADIQYMLGKTISPYMYVCWLVLSPLFCLTLFVASMVEYSELTYEHSDIVYVYPWWAVTIGWVMAFSGVVFIPIVAVVEVLKFKTPGVTFGQAVKMACEPVNLKYDDEKNDTSLALSDQENTTV